jgi:hypothetical protein
VVAAPDSPVPVRGWRCWAIAQTTDGPVLESVAAGFWSGIPVWLPRERFEATCLHVRPCDGPVPNPHHGCGIHAVTDLAEARRWARRLAAHRSVVLGQVAGWGRVVEAERGWRSRFAYPASLVEVISRRWQRPLPVDLLDKVAERYGLERPAATSRRAG